MSDEVGCEIAFASGAIHSAALLSCLELCSIVGMEAWLFRGLCVELTLQAPGGEECYAIGIHHLLRPGCF